MKVLLYHILPKTDEEQDWQKWWEENQNPNFPFGSYKQIQMIITHLLYSDNKYNVWPAEKPAEIPEQNVAPQGSCYMFFLFFILQNCTNMMQYFCVCSASCISMQLLWTRMRCEWAWEWKARRPCAKGLQMLDIPRVEESKYACCNSPPAVTFYGFCSLLQDPPSPFDRQQRSSAIIMYRINQQN